MDHPFARGRDRPVVRRFRLDALAALFLLVVNLSACQASTSSDYFNIEDGQSAFEYSGGNTSYVDLYRDASRDLKDGDLEGAEATYRQIIDLEPDHADGYIGLGSSLVLQARLDEALDSYTKALSITPDSAEALIGMGSINYRKGDYQTAVELYRSAVSLDSRNPNALWGFAISLNELGQGSQALEYLERILELVPGSAIAQDAENLIESIGQE
jgi:tetratricopeptide (TPR) repeat protein